MKTTKKAFERSPADKERRGMKEGSPKDMAMDKKQMPAMKKAMPKVGAKGTK